MTPNTIELLAFAFGGVGLVFLLALAYVLLFGPRSMWR